MLPDNSTIAAIATPMGSGGIGIIKVSGPKAFSIVLSIFKPCREHDISLTSLKNRFLYYGHIIDKKQNIKIDEVLVSFIKGPLSYTGEDTAEINAHSGHTVLKAILAMVIDKGAKLALPGEFTKRAFLNGRIDLTQAEAVIDIINAEADLSLKNAVSQLAGTMKKKIAAIKAPLLDILLKTEAAIDFPDEIEDIYEPDNTKKIIEEKVITSVKQLIKNHTERYFVREGLKVAIIGKPNVGKSSLTNLLLQKERAIVTSVPGTTRDLIEETISINGIPFIITDTAGIHSASNFVEKIGIQKTRETILQSSLILFMVDKSAPLNIDDYKIYDEIKLKKIILVINKNDIPDKQFFLPENWEKMDSVELSALYGNGADKLKDMIAANITGNIQIDFESEIVPNLRQKISLEKCLFALKNLIKAFKQKNSPELISIDLKEALDALDEITGESKDNDILEQIFSRFCIGK